MIKSSIFVLWIIVFSVIFNLSVSSAKELVVGTETVAEVDVVKAKKEGEHGEYLGAKTATHPNWFKESFLDLDEDIADATANNKRLVLYFWQPGCPYCNQLWEDNFSQKAIVDKFRNNFEIIAMNMWGDRDVVSVAGKDFTEKAFSEALSIQYTPTLLFFDENKKVIHRLNGYIPPESFKQSLEFVSGKHEKSQSFARFVQTRSLQTGSLQENSLQEGKTHKNVIENLHEEGFFSESLLNLDRSKDPKDKRKKYLAVFFEENNCKNCDLLHKKTLQDTMTRDLVKQFQSVQFHRHSEKLITTPAGEKIATKEWANKLGIAYLPAILFFDQKGKEVMRVDAQMRTFHIQSVFDYVLTEAYKTEKNFQRYISARADKIREKGIDVDIWAY